MPTHLASLPDLSLRHGLPSGAGYFHAASPLFSVLPGGVLLDADTDGLPALEIRRVRGSIFSEPYGELSMRLSVDTPVAAVFSELRESHPVAVARPVALLRGGLRFAPGPDFAGDGVAEITATREMTKTGLSSFEIRERVSAASASFLADAVIDGVLPFVLDVELRYAGMSPRLDLSVEFDPREVLEELHALSSGSGILVREEIVNTLVTEPDRLPVRLSAPIAGEQRADYAAALGDRLVSRFRRPDTVLDDRGLPVFALVDADSVGHGSFSWNLGDDFVAERAIVVSASPFAELGSDYTSEQRASLVRDVNLPTLPVGVRRVDVYGNFARNASGVSAMGTHLSAPPNPPDRPHGLEVSVALDEQQRHGSALLRFAPGEPTDYVYSAFVVVNTDNGIVDVRGTPTTSDESILLLGPADFAVRELAFELAGSLVHEADVRVECDYELDGAGHSTSVELNAGQAAQALLLPQAASGGTLRAVVTERAGDGIIVLSDLALEDQRFDDFLFAGFGAHTVDVVAEFGTGDWLVAVELVAESRVDEPDGATVLSLTAHEPRREWTWLARSVFRPGYRYRVVHLNGQDIEQEWQSPPELFSELVIRTDDLTLRVA